MDISHLVFLDETSINADMTRLYGRALKGERVNDYVPVDEYTTKEIITKINHNHSSDKPASTLENYLKGLIHQ